jgi:transposase
MKGPKRKATPGSEPPAADALELPERWSAPRKTELILRLLRGEALDAVSRESQVPAHELESWKRVFLDQGTRGLRIRGEPEERELTLARAKIGELMMRLELAEDLIEKRGSGSIFGSNALAVWHMVCCRVEPCRFWYSTRGVLLEPKSGNWVSISTNDHRLHL